MVHYEEVTIRTKQRAHWIDITSQIQAILQNHSIANGTVTVSSLHTTAGLTVNENADPSVGRDFFWKLGQLIPQETSYHHSEGNSDSHIKASLTGFSVTVPVKNRQCVLGTWQSIYFCEFDGPRNRNVSVTIIGE